jgi:preprotein translocase subunit SecB
LPLYRRIDAPPREPFSMGVRVTQITPERFEVALAVRAAAYRNDVAGYILELTYAGIFNLTNFPPEQIGAILHIQAAELLFPFMRKILANLLQANGLPLNATQHADFVAFYAGHLENRGAQGQTYHR